MAQNQPTSDLIGQRNYRIDKIKQLQDLGIDPYPSKSLRTHSNNQVVEQFTELEGKTVTVAGRVMSWRGHGELQFADLQDQSGRIQLYIQDKELAAFDRSIQHLGSANLGLLDIGDHIEATGVVTKTQRGEISVQPKFIKLLSKSIRPLPAKWGGIEDKEIRYRRRYLDMTLSPEVRQRFERRGRFWEEVRKFLNSNGFVEVNIPVLEHTTGGADAKPFVTHYDVLKEDFYLRISHELPLKRLLGAGFEKVYDLGPRFRNEGFSDEHLPEHIAMEWYWAYADFRDGMKLTQEMFRHVMQAVYGTQQFTIGEHQIDLSKVWEELDFTTIIKKNFKIDVFKDSLEKMRDVLLAHNPEADVQLNRSRLADSLWKILRKDISGPAFLTGVPKFLSPLAKSSPENPEITERFHPIIAGSEMANAFTELNDPLDQLDRFVEQQRLREGGDGEAHMMDIDFVEMLEYGMPPAVGFGMSERVFWMFENVSAREGVPFPPMRRGYENNTKKIYGDVYDFAGEEQSIKKMGKKSQLTPTKTETATDVGQDFTKKIVIILSKEIEGWRLTNTIGHISAYLGAKIGNSLRSKESFELSDGASINTNSQYPIVTLAAKPGQMANLLTKVEESGLPHLAYIKEMVETNSDTEITALLQGKSKDELEYYGIGIFGTHEEVGALTKKFSLWS